MKVFCGDALWNALYEDVEFRTVTTVVRFAVVPRYADGFAVELGVVELGYRFFGFGVVFKTDKGVAEGFTGLVVFCDFDVGNGIVVE